MCFSIEFYIQQGTIIESISFNVYYFTQSPPIGKDRQEFFLYTKCVALARQNARSDRVCLDFSLVTFFVAMTKKVIIKFNIGGYFKNLISLLISIIHYSDFRSLLSCSTSFYFFLQYNYSSIVTE